MSTWRSKRRCELEGESIPRCFREVRCKACKVAAADCFDEGRVRAKHCEAGWELVTFPGPEGLFDVAKVVGGTGNGDPGGGCGVSMMIMMQGL